MKLGIKILLAIILTIIINISGIFYFYLISSQFLEQQTILHLNTAAESRARHIETFLEEQKEKAIVIADTDSYEDFLFSEVRDKSDVKGVIEELTEILEANDDFIELFLLDKEGIVIASTNEEHIGKSDQTYAFKVEEEEETAKAKISGVHYSAFTKKNVLDVSASVVKDNFGFVGTLVMETKLEELAEITTDRTGLGESGEIYIINKDGLLITPSRFLGGNAGVLTQKVDTGNSEECLEDIKEYSDPESEKVEKHIEKIVFYADYRGENVLGTHAYVGNKWCVLAEIDESEVLGAPRIELLKVSLFIIIAPVLSLGLFGFFLNKHLKGLANGKKK